MRARVVIGANFGDEGKGLITDYLCATEGAGMVVRFNGGANAGHTVVTPGGQRHVFSHFGSGSFAGVPTYFSRFCVLNPILFFDEGKRLAELLMRVEHDPDPVLRHGIPQVYAHPDCLITTFADMMIGQKRETKARHGSTGVGVNETCRRSALSELKITMGDLWEMNRARLQSKLEQICDKYAQFRCGDKIEVEHGVEHWLKAAQTFAEYIKPMGMAQVVDPVFEGAQGLLLSEDRAEFFPHVTPSFTGMRNVRALLAEHGKIDKVDAYYVSRTYLTRHGNGPLPGHEPGLRYADDTNEPNEWQGRLRFAPLDVDALVKRCREDLGSRGTLHLALTHADQHSVPDLYWHPSLVSTGPARNNVIYGYEGERNVAIRTK